MPDVLRKDDAGEGPQCCGNDRSPGYPAPLRRLTRRCVSIQDRKSERREYPERHPPKHACENLQGAAKAQDFQRKGQFRTDYVNAENSMGFHAPAETARILGEAIDYCRQGEVEVAKLKLAAAPAAADSAPQAAPKK